MNIKFPKLQKFQIITSKIAGTMFHLKQTISSFWTKFFQKRCFLSRLEKVNIIIEFETFEFILIPTLILNKQLRFFGPNLSKKSICRPKQEKWTSSLNSAYSISLDTNFYLKQTTFIFFDQV